MTMLKFRVARGAVAKIGPGETIHLSGEQIKDRRHAIELPAGYKTATGNPRKDKPPKLDAATVKTIGTIELKAGEVFGVTELPRNLASIVEPLDAPSADAAVEPFARKKVKLVRPADQSTS